MKSYTLYQHMCKLSVYTCLRRHVYMHAHTYVYTAVRRVIYSMQPLSLSLLEAILGD